MSNVLKIFFAILVGLCSFLVFKRIAFCYTDTDIHYHIIILQAYLKQGSFAIPPLYHLFIYTLAGLSTDTFWLNWASVILLTTALLTKYFTNIRWISAELQPYKLNGPETILLAFSLLFLFPVFYDWIHFRMYLGRLATNVWHNPTTILLMPFVILLFQASLDFIKEEKPTYKQSAWILALCVLQVLIKPSFLFVFVPVFPLFVVLRSSFKHFKTWISISIAGFAFAFILVEYYLIYELNTLKIIYQEDDTVGGIDFAFLAVIKLYSANLPADMLASMFFPIIFGCLFPRALLRELSIRYAIALFLVACLIGFCLVEKGERFLHGNFLWQIYITNYLLFMVIAVESLKRIKELGYFHYKSILLIISYLLHLLSGIAYLLKLFYFQNFD